MDKSSIIKLAEAYSDHTGLKLSTISTYAANDGKWLGSLKGSASCTLRKAASVIRWFSDNWPDADLEWPSDIPRPSAKGRAA